MKNQRTILICCFPIKLYSSNLSIFSNRVVTLLFFLLIACTAHAQDQTLQWFTYFGGEEGDSFGKTIIGTDGYLYTVGSTNGSCCLSTLPTVHAGEKDVTLSKWSTDGELIWSRYYGGEGNEFRNGFALDSENNIYIGGYTYSEAGIATDGAYQMEAELPSEGFLAKINSDGETLWSTYLGSPSADVIDDLCLDNNDNLYVVGGTGYDGYPALNDHSGGSDVYIAKIDPSNGFLEWFRYIGSPTVDRSASCTVGIDNNIYISLTTVAETGMATEGAHQESGLENSVILAKVNQVGDLIWSTYISGEDREDWSSIASDPEGNIYVGGQTMSPNNIGTSGAHQEESIIMNNSPFPGAISNFIVKYNSNGEKLWGTYYGDESTSGGGGISFYGDHLYFAGTIWNNKDGYIFGDPFQPENNSTGTMTNSIDMLLMKWTKDGFPVWGTYFGGNDFDGGSMTVSDDETTIYLAGSTGSEDFYQNENSWQSELDGGDGFLARLTDQTLSTFSLTGQPYLLPYPNPTDDELVVANDKEVDVSIYKLSGALILKTSTKDKIDISELDNGIYIVQISKGNDSQKYKVVKN